MNHNISIDLDMLAGARVMDIQGNKSTRRCIVIPIDNKIGTVCDGYMGKTPDGLPTEKFFNHVTFCQEVTERMTEDEIGDLPEGDNDKDW